MPSVEITAKFLWEDRHFDNADGSRVVLAKCEFIDGNRPPSINGSPFIAKGMAEPGEMKPRATYRFLGKWTTYKNKRWGEVEDQFAFDSFVESTPAGRDGVIEYIKRAGQGNGIGHAHATTLWQTYGEDAVQMLREEPARAAGLLRGVSVEQAEAAAAWLRHRQSTERVNIDLTELLKGRGFPKSTAKRCMDAWGVRAVHVLRHDPYKLMEFRGCGFKRTDAMYMSLGLPPGRLKRQALCVWHSIAKSRENGGDTWHPIETAINGVKQNIAGADLRIGDAIRLAIRGGLIEGLRTAGVNDSRFVGKGQPGQAWLAERRKAENERYIAHRVADTLGEPSSWPDVSDAAILSDHQREKLVAALAGQICSLGGSPGTGKTFTAAVVIRRLIEQYGTLDIAVAAPTGKAAVRITESMVGYGLSIRARTIHSLLGVSSTGFRHDESLPLPFRFVIVDESSMIDTDLMAALLRACAAGTHVLFVGDVNQLSPVGHGAPLRDLIRAGLPYGELTEIRRNSGMIVEACAAIRDGKRFNTCLSGELLDTRNLAAIGPGDSSVQISAMKKSVEQFGHLGFDPVWQVQILAAVNKRSDLSRRELNRILQAELNPSPGVDGCPFRVNDKIVNTKNGYFTKVKQESDDADSGQEGESQTNERGEVYVANGELGRVVEVHEKYLIASLDSPRRTIRIPRGKSSDDESDERDGVDADKDDESATNTGCTWDLGYCLSVHKSQGSEWPVVIVMLDEYSGARRVCDRSWVYTAISRAKKLCVLVGKLDTAYRFCRNLNASARKTFLAELIERERCERLVAELV